VLARDQTTGKYVKCCFVVEIYDIKYKTRKAEAKEKER
jgi:hypothetical protein